MLLIWVCTLDKQLVGTMSVDDFCAITGGPDVLLEACETHGVHDGMEIHRTDEYIFGLTLSPVRPSLHWSSQGHCFTALPEEKLAS
jgi:hypothetical protein